MPLWYSSRMFFGEIRNPKPENVPIIVGLMLCVPDSQIPRSQQSPKRALVLFIFSDKKIRVRRNSEEYYSVYVQGRKENYTVFMGRVTWHRNNIFTIPIALHSSFCEGTAIEDSFLP